MRQVMIGTDPGYAWALVDRHTTFKVRCYRQEGGAEPRFCSTHCAACDLTEWRETPEELRGRVPGTTYVTCWGRPIGILWQDAHKERP